jgi:hypothetical protein
MGTVSCPMPKEDPQGAGLTITYLRRYGVAAIVSISQDDDDGNAASKPELRYATTPGEPPASKTKKKPSELDEAGLEALKTKFNAAQTKDEVMALVGEFTKLPPAQQNLITPAAVEARKRAGM